MKAGAYALHDGLLKSVLEVGIAEDRSGLF